MLMYYWKQLLLVLMVPPSCVQYLAHLSQEWVSNRAMNLQLLDYYAQQSAI